MIIIAIISWGTVAGMSCAAAPGSTLQGASARRIAAGTPPFIGSTSTVFELPGLWIESWIFNSLLPGGPGGCRPLEDFLYKPHKLIFAAVKRLRI